MKKTKIVVVLVMAIMLVSGVACSEEEAISTPTATPIISPSPTPTPMEMPPWVSSVQRAWTVGHPENWDADAEDDGVRVWVELQDASMSAIEYTNMNMPVLVEIYSTESVTYPWERSRLIYSASSSLKNWYEDAFVTGALGVRDINWGDISNPLSIENQEWGMLYVTATLPNSQQYSAEYYPVKISLYEQ